MPLTKQDLWDALKNGDMAWMGDYIVEHPSGLMTLAHATVMMKFTTDSLDSAAKRLLKVTYPTVYGHPWTLIRVKHRGTWALVPDPKTPGKTLCVEIETHTSDSPLREQWDTTSDEHAVHAAYIHLVENYGTWRKEISKEMKRRDESWDDVVHIAPNPGILETVFDCGFGGAMGPHFTLWTKKRVYFPVTYDGLEWVASVPRWPCDEATEHVGRE